MQTFLALLLGYILSIFYRSFLSVIAEPIMADLAIGPRELGFISSAWFIMFALMQFPVGWALDRIGPRRTVTVLMVIGAAGCVLFSYAGNWVVMATAMALIGIGCSAIFMSALYVFARENPPEKFGAMASLFIGVGSLGNLAGAAPLARMADTMGWRNAMLILAGLFVLGLISAAVFVRDPPRLNAPAQSKGSGIIAGLRDVIAIRPLWFIVPITLFSYAMLATTRGLWVAPYLSDVSGLTRPEQGNATLIMAVAMTIGVVAYGFFERRLGGPKNTVLAGNVIFAALYAALAMAGHWSAAGAVILFSLIGLVGFNYGILMAHARLFFPDHLIGRGVTFMNFFFIAGAAFVQAASGWLIGTNKAAGMSPAASFAQLHWWFAGTLVVCVALYTLSPARPAK
ncbi:MAG: MFS transporter [Beijerinckiaceae bacterium]